MTKEEFKARVSMLHESGYTGNWEEFLEKMWKLHCEAKSSDDNCDKPQEEWNGIKDWNTGQVTIATSETKKN